MENYDWQTIVSLVIVAISIVVLVRKMLLISTGRKSACGDCSSCPSSSKPPQGLKVTPLVQIEDRTA